MSDLFGALGVAARALEAQRFGLEITGQNIANAGTPGYSRRQVNLAEVPTGGVEARSLSPLRDLLLESRLRDARPGAGREAAIARSLELVEAALGRPGESLDVNITRFFDAFSELALDPSSATARRGVVLAGQELAAAFDAVAGNLAAAQRQADGDVRTAVTDANRLAAQVASLNDDVRAAAPGTAMAANLQDELQSTLHQLADVMDIDVIQHPDGTVDVTFGPGRPLVIGTQTVAIDVTPGPPLGYAVLSSGGVTVTGDITSGRLGGALAVRDTLIPQYQLDLDTLAFELADAVNTAHLAGFDAGGNPAGNFFTPLAAVSGAASALTVAPAVAADPGEVAAAGVALAGDNQVAAAIAALRDATPVSGMTFAEAWGQLSLRVGYDAQAAQQDRDSRADLLREMEALRDSVSGVSLDEEAMRLMQFQRAYEANARVFRAVDDALTTLLDMVRA